MLFEWDEAENQANIQQHGVDFRPQSNPGETGHLPQEGKKMKDEYDFSNAEQGKFYIPAEDIQVPIYLDQENTANPSLKHQPPC